MKIPFLALIFQGIPESVAIVTLSFVIAKLDFKWRRIFIIGFIVATTSYILRLLPVTFGIHTVLIMGIQFILLIQLGKGSINQSLIASLISTLSIIIIETACLSLLMPLFGVTPEILFTNTLIRILITLPQVMVTFILAFVFFKFRNRKNLVS